MDTATPTAPKKSIAQMQQDLLKFRAQKLGLPDPTEAATTTPAPEQTAEDTTNESIGAALADYRKQKSSGTLPQQEIPKEPNKLVEFAKGIFSAPATMIARPVEAVAELAGASSEDVDRVAGKISGGLVAPVPQNFKDVEKDVGRGAETIALGTGAPIAGGALFGAGASLEAGNDLLSVQTAVDAAIGGAGGKVLEWVGKPLLNAAGKVVGTITPKIIKDVAAGGAEALAKFAASHDLPFVGPISRPVSEGIARGTQAVDNAVGSGFRAGGSALKRTAAEQFPHLNPVTHYTNVAERDLMKPTTLNDTKYAKATAIYNDAKAQGIDLEKHATANRIFHDDLIGGGKFNTKDAEQSLRDSVFKDGNDIIRPALKDIEPGVRLVPISEVRQAMVDRVNQLSASKASPEIKAKMHKAIEKEYGDTSAAAKAHPNGYTLTDLHDARIERGASGKYIPGVSTPPAVVAARLAREQARVFGDLFDKAIPAGAGLAQIRREFQKNFMLADYLKALNGKKVPEGAVKKATRLFGRAAAATVGGKLGGFPGAILGSQYGDMLFASFEALPNPLKKIVLSKLAAEKSPAFDVLRQYLGDVKAERILQKKLPAPGQTSAREPGAPTLFTTPGGVSTKNKGEAIDLTAVEKGKAKAPKDGRSPATKKRLIEYVQENDQGPYVPIDSLPAIKTGPAARVRTANAQALLNKIDQGNGAPAFISQSLKQIAAENGITITDSMTPNDVIAGLRKLKAPTSLKDIKF